MTRTTPRPWLGCATVALATVLLGGCVATSDVTRADAHALVEHGAKLVDVRGASEYAENHPEAAINIPLEELRNRLVELGPRDAPVIVYCHTGLRAAIAADWLRKAGYRKVYNLGAMDRWYTETKGRPSKFD